MNFLYVKFDSEVQVDIVIHENYKFYEQSIIKQVQEKLGLTEIGDSINYDIYYFSTHSNTKNSNQNVYNYLDIEFDFG